MSPSVPIAAENSWLHRLFSGGPQRISLTGETIRLESGSGEPLAEMPIGSIEAITVSPSWFWSRLTLQFPDGGERFIGGLGERQASWVVAGVQKEAARRAFARGPLLVQLDGRMREFLAGDRYVRHSHTDELQAELVLLLGRCRGLVRKHLNEEATAALNRLAPLDSPAGFEEARERANARFIAEHIPVVREAAAAAVRKPLTDEQATAIATDEDVTLVLAGAGTGKTAVITGKVAHLVRNEGVAPHEILVLAFNRKAAEEIRERLRGAGLAANVFTFHAFGSRVIAEASEVRPSVSALASDAAQLSKAVDDILGKLLEDPRQSHTVTTFIANHSAPYRSAFDFKTQTGYEEYVRSVELRTLSGDLVKSFEELEIANYLTERGVEFRYEARYEVTTATRERRQYRPDFYLPGHDLYIEHFALNENGRPPPGWEGYAEGVKWKRGLHRQHGTRLIETYSWQHREGTLQPILNAKLKDAGVKFGRSSRRSLIQRLARQKISWLGRLLATFLNHVKTSGVGSDILRQRARAAADRWRSERFLDVFEQVRERYQQLLEREQAVDFHDLINLAAGHIRDGQWESTYRYVLVDEFQDISAGRMALLRALGRPGVAYFLVGDDWQSIYRFAGSDVSLVRNCGDHLGHVRERTLSQTFRFGEGILAPSTAFVQRNPEQTQRPLRSETRIGDEGVIVVVDGDPARGLRRALQDIERAARGRASVLVLGRYGASRRLLPRNLSGTALGIEFSTVHSAKGREADYAVILDLKDDRFGFPSKVGDDPLLELVLPPVSGRTYPFAEERRLFYVAMTRARIGTYVVTDSRRPSPFVKELQQGLRRLDAPE